MYRRSEMKRISTVFLAVVILLGIAPLSHASSNIPELTVMRSQHASFTYSLDQPTIKEAEDRLGIDIELQIFPSSDYMTKLNLLLATNDLPDILCTTYTNLVDYVPEDMFINLSDYWDKLPNYAATIERFKDLAKAFRVNGDLYWFIMTAENAPAYGNFPMVRKDVLSKIGWEKMPDNFEELYNMLKAIKEWDPNCIPMVTRGTDVLWRMGFSFGTLNNIYYEPDFDEYQYGPLYSRYKDFLAYLNRLYSEGLLDPDFASSNKTIWMEYLTSGKSYFLFENGSFATDINLVTKVTDPDAKFVPMKTLENYFGTRRAQFFEGSGVISPFRNDVWVINSESKNIDAALKFMDYMYSEEGAKLFSYGIEGVHYNYDNNGDLVFDQEKIDWYLKNANDPYREFSNEIGIGCLAVAGRFYDDAWYKFMDQDSVDMYSFWLTDENIKPYSYTLCLNADETEQVTDLKSSCSTIVSTESLKFIMGNRPLSEFDQFVEELIKAGAKEIEEVYNNAYQRTK